MQILAPLLLLQIRSSSQTMFLSRGTRQSVYFALRSEFQFSANLQNYSNRPVTSSPGSEGTPHPPDTVKPASHSPCLFTLFLIQSPCGAVWRAVPSCRGLWVYVTKAAVELLLSKVRCQVLVHLCSWRERTRPPPMG